MSVGKVVEWCIIAVVVILGIHWISGLLDNIGSSPSPQTLGPGAPGYIGWPYGTGVVQMYPGIVGPQWGGARWGGGQWGRGPWTGPARFNGQPY